MKNSVIAIPIDRLFVYVSNPRTIRQDDRGLLDLAESMKVHGQLQAGIVRTHPDPDMEGMYEVLAGNRRLVAARIAGLETYEAKVVDMNDHLALEMVITENLQREDLTPLEEARAIKALCNDGRTMEETARVLGKTVSWVARRTKLLDLHKGIAAAVEDPESIMSLWTVGMLEDVACLPQETQRQLSAENHWSTPTSVAGLKNWISQAQRLCGRSSVVRRRSDSRIQGHQGPARADRGNQNHQESQEERRCEMKHHQPNPGGRIPWKRMYWANRMKDGFAITRTGAMYDARSSKGWRRVHDGLDHTRAAR